MLVRLRIVVVPRVIGVLKSFDRTFIDRFGYEAKAEILPEVRRVSREMYRGAWRKKEWWVGNEKTS